MRTFLLAAILLVPATAHAGSPPRIVTAPKSPAETARTDIVVSQVLMRMPDLLGKSYSELFQAGFRLNLFVWDDGVIGVVLSPRDQLRPYPTQGYFWAVPSNPRSSAHSYVVPAGSYIMEAVTTKHGVDVSTRGGHQPRTDAIGFERADSRISHVMYFP